MAEKAYGKTASGKPVTDELVEHLAETAEAGYDVEETLQRRVGRPAMGSSAARVGSVRLEPELRSALVKWAQASGMTPSAVIRDALRSHLRLDEDAWHRSSARPFHSRAADLMLQPGWERFAKHHRPVRFTYRPSRPRTKQTSQVIAGFDVDQSQNRELSADWEMWRRLLSKAKV